jgi:galactokinase
VDLASLDVVTSESGTAAALIRGCAQKMRELGFHVGGFDAAIVSDVLPGSGLSSSAALEMLICAIFDRLFNEGSMSPILRAQVGQYAENVYFGKPCGLLDQMGSSFGGLVAIDFQKKEPTVETLSFDFLRHGYALAIVNTGKGHGELTGEYAAIPAEMKRVAAFFGCDRLREVDSEQFYSQIPELYGRVPDRAILRAMHFFEEDARVPKQVQALRAGDLQRFLDLINESGQSSITLLQNIHVKAQEQPLSIALALSAKMLKGKGAWRVHGGGFAGTILSFVPLDMMDQYAAHMNAVFGANACVALMIRPVGAYEMQNDESEVFE